jgi:hypothetical protein
MWTLNWAKKHVYKKQRPTRKANPSLGSTNRNDLTKIQGNMDLFLFLFILKYFKIVFFIIDLHQMSVFFPTYAI